MRHTGEKPYKCKYCKYSAIQAISLKTHMRNKHPGCEGVFACESCPYRTVNEQHFTDHLKDHKNGLITNVQTRKPANVSHKFVVNNSRSLVNKILPPALTPVPRQILTMNGQPISTIQVPGGAEVQTVQPAEVDTSQANTMLLSKVANLSMVQGDMNTARIIYTALGALSSKGIPGTLDGGQHGVDVGQPTVQSATQDGVTTHTITFHIPPQGEGGDGDKQHAIQVENFSQVGAPNEAQVVSAGGTNVGGATIEEGQVLLALHAQGGATSQEQLNMEGAEVVYTTEVAPSVTEGVHSDTVQHLVCEGQETITMEVTQGEPTQVIQAQNQALAAGNAEVVPIDITETTVVEVAQNTEASLNVSEVQDHQQEEPVVMNLISKDDVTGDAQVQYITIS